MSDEAKRDNAEKPDLSLIPYAFEVPVARVMMGGAAKYGKLNYLKGHRITSLIASIKRHTGQLLSGEDIDKESGESHWAHIAAGCLMALHQIELGTIKDDRPRIEAVAAPVLDLTPREEPAVTWDVVVTEKNTAWCCSYSYLTREEAQSQLEFHRSCWPEPHFTLMVEERPNDRATQSA